MIDTQKFLKKVEITDTCWLWKGYITPDGYGFCHYKGRKSYLAHRTAYELFRGNIPNGLTIDHLCRTRHCVNPVHLEAVSLSINVLRGIGYSAINAKKDTCVRGHLFDKKNTFIRKRGLTQERVCRICRKIRYMKCLKVKEAIVVAVEGLP